jgi:hypothetical protein
LSGPFTPRATGWITGEARLIGVHDALALDDRRPFVLDVRPAPTYALITRDSAKPHASSSHFVERALVPIKSSGPDGGGGGGERVIRIDPVQLDREALATADLIVLDHPGKLAAETINLLASMVRRGRGMLYVASEPIDAENLRQMADVVGNDVKMPVQFVPPPANESRGEQFLLEWRKDQPPFRELAETMAATAGTMRFSGGLSSQRLEGGLQDDVLATYSDRSACLVVTACGAGALAVLNADLPMSDLPSSPVFVPMMGELCGRLLATRQTPQAVACGEPMAMELSPDVTSLAGLSVTAPAGAERGAGNVAQEGNSVVWRSQSAGPPGVYQVKRGDETLIAAATAPPASESDLQSLDPKTLTTKLVAGRDVYFEGAGEEPPKDQAWAWLLVACAACMIGELGALILFRT